MKKQLLLFFVVVSISNFSYAGKTSADEFGIVFEESLPEEQIKILYGENHKRKILIYPDDRFYAIHYNQKSQGPTWSAVTRYTKRAKGSDLQNVVEDLESNDKNTLIAIEEEKKRY